MTMTTINHLIYNLLLRGLNSYVQDRSGKRQLIRMIIVFNYSGVSFLGKTPITAPFYFAGLNNSGDEDENG